MGKPGLKLKDLIKARDKMVEEEKKYIAENADDDGNIWLPPEVVMAMIQLGGWADKVLAGETKELPHIGPPKDMDDN